MQKKMSTVFERHPNLEKLVDTVVALKNNELGNEINEYFGIFCMLLDRYEMIEGI